ncbi:hypothetical protein [Spiroplasma turonicum]|nr:hypothetical protein [Spiroplasma turonicum]ALX70887.1 hypothetical protein STURO_v1c06260 [Spiroplasma turonicum]
MPKTKLFTADEKMKIVNEFLSSDISAKKKQKNIILNNHVLFINDRIGI